MLGVWPDKFVTVVVLLPSLFSVTVGFYNKGLSLKGADEVSGEA